MSFIYQNKYLLDQLVKIGQNYTPAQLKSTLQSLIQNLQIHLDQSFNHLTPQALSNLSTFLKWLTDENKTYNGQKIVYLDNELQNLSKELQLKTVDNFHVLTPAFTGFVNELHQRAQDPVIKQLVDNLMAQAKSAGLLVETNLAPEQTQVSEKSKSTSPQPTSSKEQQKSPSQPHPPTQSLEATLPFENNNLVNLESLEKFIEWSYFTLGTQAGNGVRSFNAALDDYRGKLGTDLIRLIPLDLPPYQEAKLFTTTVFSVPIQNKKLLNKDIEDVCVYLQRMIGACLENLRYFTLFDKNPKNKEIYEQQVSLGTNLQQKLGQIAAQLAVMK